ncbi:MAG: hypothetical protein K2M06_03805, partial [Muribaculaceae bacterium]|nr:hypothetical protein [Muribaculaceae bacterium]
PDPIDPDPIDPDPIDGIPAAPAPGLEPHQVKSFYSGAYPTIVPNMFVGSWGQSTKAEIMACGGDEAYRLTNFNYLGFQFSGSDDVVDISDMKYIHIDLYSTRDMDINIHPISLNPTVDGDKATKHLTAGEWHSFDMPMTDFPNVNFASLGQFKFENMTPAQAPAVKRAADAGEHALYLDNLYAWAAGTTGISSADAELPADGKVYDLFGRIVRDTPCLDGLAKGIYIVGGRKVAVTR